MQQAGGTPDMNDIESYDGALLVAPEGRRLAVAEELGKRIEALLQTDGEPCSPDGRAERYGEIAKLLSAIERLYEQRAPEAISLARFRVDDDLDDVWRGTEVVFMGYDRSLHRVGLPILAAIFHEEKLVLGAEYVVLELPDDERGYSFAIRGPSGRRLYLDYTFFGRRIGEDPDRFVTDWAV